MSECIVLLSGGADSTICALIAKQEYSKVHALTINYGQRHLIELQSANAIAKALNLDSHEILALDQNVLKSYSPCLSSAPVEEYDSADELPSGVASTLVPGRNQLFLTIAANRAMYLKLNTIFTGVCETDYSGYPDCRREFIEQLEETTSLGIFGNNSQISIMTPLMYKTKAKSILLAKSMLGDRFDNIMKLTHTCFPPESLIHTKEGLKEIQELKIQDFVYSHTGKLKKITNVMKREYEGYLYTIKVYGSPPISCTPDHPIFTSKGFVPASELTIRDNDCLIPQIKLNIKKTNFSGSLKLSKEFALFLGVFAAEGSYRRNKKPWDTIGGIDLSISTEEIHHPIIQSAISYLNKISINKIDIRQNSIYENGTNIILWDSKFAQSLADLIGEQNDLYRCFDCVLTWDSNYQFEFLKGYLFGNAFYNQRTELIQASGINLNLLNVVYNILLQNDKMPTITRIPAKNCNGNYDQYQVRLRDLEWSELVYETFNVIPRTDRRHNDCFVKREGRKVFSIEKKWFKGHVYNISVEDDESYIVETIPVHNCYKGVKGGCGKCAACILRDRGFKEANMVDPIWNLKM